VRTAAAGPRYEIFHDVLAEAVLAWRGGGMRQERRIEAEATGRGPKTPTACSPPRDGERSC